MAVYGGKPIREQIEKLRKGAQIVIGTPGRVLDHLARGTIDFTKLKVVVLDEADRMLDIGFRPDIEKILRRCPSDRQTLLLSATVPPPIAKLAERYMQNPETLNFSPKDVSVETIEQFYFTVDPQQEIRAARPPDLDARSPSKRSSSAAPSAAPRRSFSGCRRRSKTRRSSPASTATWTRAPATG